MSTPNRELLRLIPNVLRARDFHLYLDNGKRLTDLWLDGGRAVMGHKASRILVELKNAAERGLFTALPHQAEKRYVKAIGEFFPGFGFRLYTDEASMHRALINAGIADAAILKSAASLGAFPDPAFPKENNPPSSAKYKYAISLWRPFLEPVKEEETCEEKIKIIIPILPWNLGPTVLVFDKSLDTLFPTGDLIPPVLLAPAARALYNLAAEDKIYSPNYRRYKKIDRVLQAWKIEKKSTNDCIWRQKGIYLTTNIDAEKYKTLFIRFLEAGFLLPPSPSEPLILPLQMSNGEESKLAKLLKRDVE